MDKPGCSCDLGHDHSKACLRGRLYEAAPALLEALEWLVHEHSRIVEDSSDSEMRPDEDCERARAAIRAAKGESHG